MKNLELKKHDCTLLINETSAEVPLQALLNATCNRLLKFVKPEFMDDQNEVELTLICKWGFGGSSGYTAHKEQWSEEEGND